jgi:hypothetical protein
MTNSKTKRVPLSVQLSDANSLYRQAIKRFHVLRARGKSVDEAEEKSGLVTTSDRQWRIEERALKRGTLKEKLVVLKRRIGDELPVFAEIAEILAACP